MAINSPQNTNIFRYVQAGGAYIYNETGDGMKWIYNYIVYMDPEWEELGVQVFEEIMVSTSDIAYEYYKSSTKPDPSGEPQVITSYYYNVFKRIKTSEHEITYDDEVKLYK